MHSGTASDDTLIELRARALAGDQEAVTALLVAIHAPVERYLRRRLRGAYATSFVADLVQETLVRVVEALGACRATSDRQVVAWVLAVARNIALDLLRSSVLRISLVALIDEMDTAGAAVEAREEPTGSGPLERIVGEAYGALNPATQELLWRRLIARERWSEIAAALGTTQAGAKRRYQRAIARLRGHISGRIRQLADDERALAVQRLRRLGIEDLV